MLFRKFALYYRAHDSILHRRHNILLEGEVKAQSLVKRGDETGREKNPGIDLCFLF